MTDKETNLEFVERMEAAHVVSGAPVMYSRSNMLKILHLAKTTALIEEHKINLHHIDRVGIPDWLAYTEAKNTAIERGSLFEAVLAVADKIKERT